MTPTLSVDAVQETLTLVPTTAVATPEGAVGGLESATLAGTSFEDADEVAGSVLGLHLVVVAADRKPAVAIARPRRLGDPVARNGVKPALVPR